ncbi:MAG: CDP-alcohol phosphatidyltransferase family protein [Nitrososphaeria archaeon]
MVLNRIREKINPVLSYIGKYFSMLGIPAWGWTLFGLTFSLFSMLFYMTQSYVNGTFGGIFFLLSGFMDVVDGAVAKYTNTISKLGNFVDSTADRLGEILVCFGLLVGGWATADILFIMITFSIMVSYVRAKGDSLNVDLRGFGLGERAERMFVLAISSILGYTYYGILIVCALAIITFLQRSIFIMRLLRK